MIVVFHLTSPHICLKCIVATSVIEQLTLSTLTKVLLKCRFSLLFSFTASITLCPLSSQDSSSLNSNSPSQQHKIRLPNNAPMELPNGLSPSSFLLVKSKAWDKVQGSWFEVFLL